MKWILIYLSLLGIIISLWLIGWNSPRPDQVVSISETADPVLASGTFAPGLAILGLAGILLRHFERKRTPKKKLHGEI